MANVLMQKATQFLDLEINSSLNN